MPAATLGIAFLSWHCLPSKGKFALSSTSDGFLGCLLHTGKPSRIHVIRPSRSSMTIALGPYDVSPLGVGTWSWGNRLLFGYTPDEDPELQRAFNAAVLRGVNLFDTADSYGTGARLNARAETLLGIFLRECPVPTDKIVIATKFATYPWRLTRSSISDAAARSAERLGRPISIGQIHWSASSYAPWQERALWDGLADAKEKGYCLEVGVSNYGPRQLAKVHKYLKEERNISLASCQVQLSLLSRLPLENGTIGLAKKLGVGVIGYSPLALGLLTCKYRYGTVPRGPRGFLFQRLLRNATPLTDQLQLTAEKLGKTPSQIAIAWCLSRGVAVITGVRTERHAEEGITAADIVLSEKDCFDLERAADLCSRQMIQNSFQTQ